jgi:hypothetical protein
MRVDGNVTGLTATLKNCGWIADKCEIDGGGLIFLDRGANIACPANKVLTDWNVVNCGNGLYRLQFYCCLISVQ